VLSPLTTVQPCNPYRTAGGVCSAVPSINGATVQRSAAPRRGGPQGRGRGPLESENFRRCGLPATARSPSGPNPLRHGVYDPVQDDEVKVNPRVPGIERIELTAGGWSAEITTTEHGQRRSKTRVLRWARSGVYLRERRQLTQSGVAALRLRPAPWEVGSWLSQ